jgi:ankyrin repeat protein
LIEFGADLDAIDNTQRTPLDIAMAEGREDVCHILRIAMQRL